MKTSDFLGGGGGGAIKLKGAQPVAFIPGSNGAIYGAAINVSGINISAGLTQLCSVDVPAGKEMIILDAQIASGLTTTAQTTLIEIEKDGETVLTSGSVSTNTDRLMLVGNNVTSTNSKIVANLGVSTNFKIRAQKAAGTSVTVQVTYILTEKS